MAAISRRTRSARNAPAAAALALVAAVLAAAAWTARGDGAGASPSQGAGTAYRYLYEIQGTAPVGTLTSPADVAAAPDGTLYVVDDGDHQVRHYDAEGNLLSAWGARGHAPGRFFFPLSVAVGPDGTVYVADGGNFIVQRFTRDGRFLSSWGGRGGGAGQFGDGIHRPGSVPVRVGPTRLAAGRDGPVYALDPGNERIQAFSADGAFLRQWSIAPADASDRRVVSAGMAVAPNGDVLLVEHGILGPGGSSNWFSMLRRFGATGTLLETWPRLTVDPTGVPVAPLDVDAAPDGSIFITSDNEPRVIRYAADGATLATWGNWSHGTGLLAPSGVAASPDGSVAVVDRDGRGVHRFTLEGAPLSAWAGGPYGPAQLRYPVGIDVSAEGHLYVADARTDRVYRFGAGGELESVWGEEGDEPGSFRRPADVSVSADGEVFVADKGNDRVQVFDGDGRLLRVLADGSARPSRTASPDRLEVAGDGTLYLLGAAGVAQRFGVDGTYLGPAAFHATHGHGIDDITDVPARGARGDELFVLGLCFHRYRTDGSLLESWPVEPWFDDCGGHATSAGRSGSAGRAQSALSIPLGPRSVQPGPHDTVFVSHDDRVSHFAADGTLLAEWGSFGYDPGNLNDAADLAVMPETAPPHPLAPAGSLFVSDLENRRVQVFGDEPIAWRVSAYDNAWVLGAPTAITATQAIELDWGDAAPDPRVPPDGFSVRVEREIVIGGSLRFHLAAEGGARLWVGEHLLVDRWDAERVMATAHATLPEQAHWIRLEFVDPGGPAAVRLTWEPDLAPDATPTAESATPPPSPSWAPNGASAFLPLAGR